MEGEGDLVAVWMVCWFVMMRGTFLAREGAAS